jgi:hypothetical protein
MVDTPNTPKPPKRTVRTASTQQYLPIEEIRDNVVVLRDGTLRAAVLASSMNFALKSEEEQSAVIQAYVSFLNSLDFTLQIVVQSRRLNIEDYLRKLKERADVQTNELLRQQTLDYAGYVSELVQLSDIMTKRFYAVVPYSPHESKKKGGFFTKLRATFSPATIIHLKQKQFDEYRAELGKRVDFVLDGLGAIGLKGVQLDTQGLIELLYNTYNPESYDAERIVEVGKLKLEDGA